MNTQFPNETTLRQYLLGMLPEPEWEEIEQQLLREDDLAGNIEVVEDEIIEDYLQGSLSADERRAVEIHFLQPPERRRKLWFARLLRSHLQGQQQPVFKPIAIPFFRRPVFSWAMSLATATLLMAVVALSVYTVNLTEALKSEKTKHLEVDTKLRDALNRDRNPGSPTLPAASRNPALPNNLMVYLRPPSSPVILNLVESSRADSGIPVLNQNVEIHIPLVHNVLSSYRATLQNTSEGKTIWSKTGLKPTGSQLIFKIPGTILSPATYSVIVQGEGDTHQATYPFVVR